MADLIFPASLPSPTYPIAQTVQDSVIRSDFENGSQQTRQKYTLLRQGWTLNFTALTDAQRTVLHNFYATDTAGGAAAFTWTNQEDTSTHTVRFTAAPTESKITPSLWSVSMNIMEI